MKILIPLFLALLMAFNAHAGISLTEEQFQNLDIIHEELKKKDVNFVGLNGSRDNMQVIGMGEDQAKKEIAKIDFPVKRAEKKQADPKNQKIRTLRTKLKAAVPDLTDAELDVLVKERD